MANGLKVDAFINPFKPGTINLKHLNKTLGSPKILKEYW